MTDVAATAAKLLAQAQANGSLIERAPVSEQQAIMARIDRDLAESAKMREELNRNIAQIPERYRLENAKLRAEARKLRWDPLFVVLGAIIAGLLFRLDLILHLFGAHS